MNSEDDSQEVKRFFAPTMARALELVRDEMGPEAIILSSARVDGGVEVITSLERDYATRGVGDRRAFGQNFDTDFDHAMESDSAWRSEAGIQQAAESYESYGENNGPSGLKSPDNSSDLSAALERAREKMLAAQQAWADDEKTSPFPEASAASKRAQEALNRTAHTPSRQRDQARAKTASADKSVRDNKLADDKRLDELKGEIADLRMLLEEQMWSVGRHTAPPSIQQSQMPANIPGMASGLAGRQLNLKSHLQRLGLTESMVDGLCSGQSSTGRLSDIWKSALAQLSQQLQIDSRMRVEKGGRYAFVGPAGVGKTTTIAKLAARYAMEHGPGKVALVSMDIHRVGALDQLKSIGNILDAPVRSVSASQSLMSVLSELRQFELVLVDTAGYRHGEPKLREQLSSLDEQLDLKRFLVLSSSSQYQNLKASVHAYSSRRPVDACVLTKVDEASTLGEAISALIDHRLGLAYVTDGQEIPKDISRATAHGLIAKAVALSKEAMASQAGSHAD